ncbi:MAG: nucleoside triphosphate pyrophosphohydrolase [Rhodospirillaceae bacterium]|nr:nucleoside triphosphate pyrophosphohydrolase [Rhodospirillaceae bacterium]
MSTNTDKSPSGIDLLVGIMERLRDPKTGCPWDVEQTFTSIAPHTIEEAYEVADAIDSGDMNALKDELGDLLFQIIFYAQMAKEQGVFDLEDIARSISDKMIRRHPHVFGDNGPEINTAHQQTENWEKVKESERAGKTTDNATQSALDGVTRALPALLRAIKLQKRAARVGFDWPDVEPVFQKFDEELAEIRHEIAVGNQKALENEVGDLLFTCVNLARKLNVDAETSLRNANQRFEARFRGIEQILWDDGSDVTKTPLDQLEQLWQHVKKEQSANND